MTLLASDDSNPAFVGARDPDSALFVEFFEQEVKHEFRSNLEGRPIYEMVDMIRITVPGNQTFNVVATVRDDHRQRFPRQWAAFKATKDQSAEQAGTPITAWPLIDKAQAAELRALKFTTVESIANASDVSIQAVKQIGNMAPFALRERARAFLAVASNTAAAQQYAEAAEKQRQENAELRDAIKAMQAQIEAMTRQQAESPAPAAGSRKADKVA